MDTDSILQVKHHLYTRLCIQLSLSLRCLECDPVSSGRVYVGKLGKASCLWRRVGTGLMFSIEAGLGAECICLRGILAVAVCLACEAVPPGVPVAPALAVAFAAVLVPFARLLGAGVAVAFVADVVMLAKKVVVTSVVAFERVTVKLAVGSTAFVVTFAGLLVNDVIVALCAVVVVLLRIEAALTVVFAAVVLGGGGVYAVSPGTLDGYGSSVIVVR